jgi:hypothetical protein
MEMKYKYEVAAATLALTILGTAAFGTNVERLVLAATNAGIQGNLQSEAQDQNKSDPPAKDTPLTRAEIIKQGPGALEHNCTRCHGSDKWEGTNRDHDGWAAIVKEMSRQMTMAQMPPMSNKTTNLIIDYLSLTHPQ